MQEKKSAPSIFEYLDVRSYLQDYYKWRKAEQKDFSYEFWNEELSFNSRSYIRMMIMGKKKVSEKFVQAFSKLNFASPTEEEYFFYLVQYSQSRNQKDRQAYGAKLMQLLKTRPQQSVITPEADFISSPLLIRLYTLLGFRDIKPTLTNLAKLMMISESQTETFLKKFEELELAKSSLIAGEEHWTALHDRIKIPDNKGSINLLQFHEASLKDAINAFGQPKNLRKYRSLICPLTEEELVELYSSIDDFIDEKVSRHSPAYYDQRRLFQLNFNIHPVANAADPHMLRAN